MRRSFRGALRDVLQGVQDSDDPHMSACVPTQDSDNQAFSWANVDRRCGQTFEGVDTTTSWKPILSLRPKPNAAEPAFATAFASTSESTSVAWPGCMFKHLLV